jgi:hypothetical protein
MNSNPRLFIGSASESLDIARSLEYELQNVARTEVWDSAFRPGHYTLEELMRKVAEVDFAAFILGQEDLTTSRGQITISPRDNVVYEAGLFAGRLGVSRVFLLVDARGIKIPTDWKGLGYIPYDPSTATANDAVHQAAVMIRKEISDWTSSDKTSFCQRILGGWWQFVVNNKEGSVISLLNIKTSVGFSAWEVSGTAWTCEGKSIAKYWSNAAALHERDRKLFYYWEGKHPFDESIPAFFGVGEIQFDDSEETISKADGWFSESPLANLDETVRKSTKYMRASKADVEIMNGNDRMALEKLIKSRVEEWKNICT